MTKLLCINIIVVWVEKTVSARVLFYQDFSPHELCDVFSLPGGEAHQGDQSDEEDGQDELAADGGGGRGGGGLVITADHTGSFLSSQCLFHCRVRVEHSHWSRYVEILCSDWWNLTMLAPRSMP